MKPPLGGKHALVYDRIMRGIGEEWVRGVATAVVLAMIFAQVVVFHFNWILSSVAIVGAVFLVLTRHRVPLSRLPNETVYWHPHGLKPRKVKVLMVTSEPDREYALLELGPGEIRNAPLEELRFPLSMRLKYSWRFKKELKGAKE